jgi:hypothetical protein
MDFKKKVNPAVHPAVTSESFRLRKTALAKTAQLRLALLTPGCGLCISGEYAD